MITRIKKVKVLVVECDDCGLEIEGSTREQLQYNLNLHKDKHARDLK